jgi:hypothetical protein
LCDLHHDIPNSINGCQFLMLRHVVVVVVVAFAGAFFVGTTATTTM